MAPHPLSQVSPVAASDFTEDFSSLPSVHDEPVALNASPPATASPTKASPATGPDRHEFSDTHIEILFQIVRRAEDLLPSLPPTYRRPIPALFKAYNEVLPQHGIDPVEDQQITKLVFKVGGVHSCDSLMDKFRVVMARMEIRVEITESLSGSDQDEDEYQDDVPPRAQTPESVTGRSPSRYPEIGDTDDGDDGLTSDNDLDEYSDEYTDEPETLPKFSDAAMMDPHQRKTPAMVPAPTPGPAHATTDVPYVDPQQEASAVAFCQRYYSRFSALSAIRKWHRRSAYINNLLADIEEARHADLEDDAEDVFHEWRATSIKIQEIAARTNQIYSARRAFATWRQRSAQGRPTLQQGEHEPLDPMERLASKAYRNLVLSRAFVQWSNRSEDESKKAQLAEKAYELSLKSKVFGTGSRHHDTVMRLQEAEPGKPEETRGKPPTEHPEPEARGQSRPHVTENRRLPHQEALRSASLPEKERTNSAPSSQDIDVPRDDVSATLRRKADMARKLAQVRNLAQRMKSEPPSQLSTATGKGTASKSATDHQNPSDTNQTASESPVEEYDEMTLIARRHILRMRYLTAWESYTVEHTRKVKHHALRKTIGPWRERAAETQARNEQYFEHRQEQLFKNTLHMWEMKSNQNRELVEKAHRYEKGQRVLGTFKPWIAASREKQNLVKMKAQAFSHWHDQPNDDATFGATANEFNYCHRSLRTLSKWKFAADEEKAKTDQLEEYGKRADYYHTTTTTLRAWMAAAREAASERAMKVRALDGWSASWQDENAREEKLSLYATRANFYCRVNDSLPIWQIKAKEAAQQQEQLQEYAERADFYYGTRDVLVTWRNNAKQRRRDRLKDAHLATRRMVKKGMGQRCISQWRAKLQPSFERFEAMNTNLDNVLADREWLQVSQAFSTWRSLTLTRNEMGSTSDTVVKQRAIEQWRERAEFQQEIQMECQDYWAEKAMTAAYRGWSLRSLQNSSRPHTLANALEKKDRRHLRQDFREWHRKTVDIMSMEAAIAESKRGSVMNTPAKDAPAEIPPSHTRGLFSARKGRATAIETVAEETPHTFTPGRPQFFLGPLNRRETMTPLAPVPSSASWQGGRDSILGESAIGARSGRAKKTRNLRVSWAQ